MGEGVPSTLQNQQSKEPPTKGDPRELVAEGVFQACFQHSILIETNTSPFVGWGLEMHVMCSFLSFKLHFKLGNISEIF